MPKKSTQYVNQILALPGFPKILDRSCVYVAVPITSGLRLWELALRVGLTNVDYARHRYPVEFESQVLLPNIHDAEMLEFQVKQMFPEAQVVNPATVEMPGWSQGQYRRAWKDFITRFVTTIVVSPNWQYSHGCVVEVVHALRSDICVLDDSLGNLSLDLARQTLEATHCEATKKGLYVSFLQKFVKTDARIEAEVA